MTASETIELLTLTIKKTIEVKASATTTFEALLEEIGHAQRLPDGTPMPMVVEAWPGGRWYRDTGSDTGHLWGHVQVIKPPTLLEFCGPMFMSYPAQNHVQYRLTETDGTTKIDLTHRAFGDINPEHRKGVHMGWELILKRVAERAAK